MLDAIEALLLTVSGIKIKESKCSCFLGITVASLFARSLKGNFTDVEEGARVASLLHLPTRRAALTLRSSLSLCYFFLVLSILVILRGLHLTVYELLRLIPFSLIFHANSVTKEKKSD